jgi:hypothetical protein
MSAGREPAGAEYMTPSEVRDAFQVHPYTVARWGRAGRLTSVRTPGGHRRYLTSEVRALLAAPGDAPRPEPDPAGMSTETPAQTMRSAARLMRERATSAACDGMSRMPWQAGAAAPCGCCEVVTDGAGGRIATVDDRQAAYIASMHPLVGAALAELLDKIAWMVGIDPDLMGRVGCEEVLKIARAYLGEVSR